jgi:hypothetical protein
VNADRQHLVVADRFADDAGYVRQLALAAGGALTVTDGPHHELTAEIAVWITEIAPNNWLLESARVRGSP